MKTKKKSQNKVKPEIKSNQNRGDFKIQILRKNS